MSIVVTAPQAYTGDNQTTWKVFLAGAIDMGAAVDWQSEVIEHLSGYQNIAIFNPRRKAFTPDTLDEQIWWELDALKKCNTVFMWLPKDSRAPISLFEAGLYWTSGKLCIGADPEFYRRRNLEITGKFYGVYVYHSLEETLQSLTKSLDRLGYEQL